MSTPAMVPAQKWKGPSHLHPARGAGARREHSGEGRYVGSHAYHEPPHAYAEAPGDAILLARSLNPAGGHCSRDAKDRANRHE